ncbi:DNA polymerase I [Leuconostoc falkenbergense]|uniref:DNA polymerase I n=1 Tax=Leuconostoc falkenbergense TaxID=2766470 RepID=UPI0021AB075A|nr:DNA polymerase I [Leuconostoc falkenbergense]MCT4418667.1 DNA polymerase I [Leuconostoc falkenbergense]
MTNKKLLLIDGNSLAFRAFYAMYNQLDRMISHDGLHTNALVAFNNFLDQIVDPMQPDLAVVAWDAGSGKTTFRGELLSSYKDGRSKTPSEFLEQFPYLREMVALHGLRNYQQEGLEADDIIGTYSRLGEAAGYSVTIVTGDQDLIQLATDNITVNVTKKGVTEIERYTPDYILEKFNLTPAQIIEKKALTGDTSDNYPGVTKVGEKTALKLLAEYHDLDNLYAYIDGMKPSKMKENLINDRDQAFRARQLATILTAADLELPLEEIEYRGVDYDALIPFYEKLDFKQQLAKIKALKRSGQIAGDDTVGEKSVQVVELKDSNLCALSMLGDKVALHIEYVGEDYHAGEMIGFVIGNAAVGYYGSRDVSLLQQSEFKTLVENDKIQKNVFNVKAQLVLFKRLGLKLTGVNFDFLLAAYLLDTVDNDNVFATLAQRFDIYLTPDEEVYGKGAKFKIPSDSGRVLMHIANKANALMALEEPTFSALNEHQQTHLYTDIELPLAHVLANMEFQGIKVNPEYLQERGRDLAQRIEDIQSAIYIEAGEKINLNSPKQLGVLLFEKMGLPVIKKTKTGYSTAIDVLEKLAPQAPIVDHILQYRQLAKLKSTYIDGLLSVIYPEDSKIHTRFLQTLTQTGRLSSVDPNLQNIPMRSEEGRLIRTAFIPSEPNWQIFGADYSQIELRVLAHVTGDANMQKAFLNGEDIHAETARAVFGLPNDAVVDPLMRRTAKAVNFGIVYGISDFGLANNLGISRAEAKRFIDTYFQEFPQIHDWMNQIKQFAHDHGYVETIAHRRRYLPDINAKNFNLRSFAERTAMNSPIQGSAADIIKIAMIKVNDALKAHHFQARMLLQVHDELIFEAPSSEIDALSEIITSVMDSAVSLDVPLKVESHSGATWYDAK